VNIPDSPENPIQPTPDETRLLEQLRSNPLIADRLTHIMDRFEAEIAGDGDAHQAESMLIDELRQLGTSMLGQWARSTHAQSIQEAKDQEASLTNHAKKNSSGIPLSERSK
jgi:hypothetical protein